MEILQREQESDSSDPAQGTVPRAAKRKAKRSAPSRYLDAQAQTYYGKIRKDIEAASYATLLTQFAGAPGATALSDAELKKRLSTMYANYGKDDTTSPEAIVTSGLPTEFLIGELSRIRERMFYRISDEALTDIAMTNALLNTLRYRSK